MSIEQYIAQLQKHFALGNATEHTYRGFLSQLVEHIVPEVIAVNEPKRQRVGAPDYVIRQAKMEVNVGYIEAKNIGDKDLLGEKKTGNKEQFDRYKSELNNIFFTDYLDFYWFKEGQLITQIAIGELQNGKITPLPHNFQTFTHLFQEFCSYEGLDIKNSRQLAAMMARNAQMLAEKIEAAINSDQETEENSTLRQQMMAFKEVLIHDITPKSFADVYAQTITYGLFAARYHDPSLPTFSRQEAAELIPKTNPFLRKLFSYIAGPDIDSRIDWIVINLVQIFKRCNVVDILQEYGKNTKMEDPIIHFYEDFLTEYDKDLRKARGVWYTPQPVVQFIVKAVDDILKTDFDLPQGLADTSKTTIKVATQNTDRRYKDNTQTIDKEVHRVQILDPATGTGTFLAETVKHIFKKFRGQQGIWSNYVQQHLIPRLNGFELLMASYAMAHLKMEILLAETGFKSNDNKRLRIYLTNSLEESHPDTGTLFANWLSSEANEANHIKRDTPVMCIIGNPPYSGESANKGEWIMQLMEDFKKEPGGKEKLNERNSKWINDDYVKFIRYGQHFIEKNENGILAFINPHGFLDNPTFRGMRWHLLKTFDKIYTIDLHGNSKKKETAPDGGIDQNVFDIMQGVSINIFVKTNKKKKDELAEVYNFDLFGKREFKYDFLIKNSLSTIPFVKLPCNPPMYLMVQKNYDAGAEYDKGFAINELFKVNSVGIVTARDAFTIHFSKNEVKNTIEEFLKLDEEAARIKFDLGKDARDWQVNFAKKDLQNFYPNNGKFTKIAYRPFDDRFTFYTGKSKGFHCMPRNEVMKHFLKNENFGLTLCKQFKSGNTYQHILATNKIIESSYVSNKTSEITSVFPLYLYPTSEDLFSAAVRVPNLNMELVAKMMAGIGGNFVAEAIDKKTERDVSPLDILDYIYAVLHSPSYREKYKEFLKIDFPKVPASPDLSKGEEHAMALFVKMCKIGSQLRSLHLLESPTLENYITEYPNDGDNQVEKIGYENGNVYINYQKENQDKLQCFTNVPESVWNFYIGGYQPAQKWLKDRKGRALDFDDILHYQRIIVALSETERLMTEMDKIVQF